MRHKPVMTNGMDSASAEITAHTTILLSFHQKLSAMPEPSQLMINRSDESPQFHRRILSLLCESSMTSSKEIFEKFPEAQQSYTLHNLANSTHIRSPHGGWGSPHTPIRHYLHGTPRHYTHRSPEANMRTMLLPLRLSVMHGLLEATQLATIMAAC